MPGVQFVGEISEAEKSHFLGGALALLFPISWPEPFGLVMIETMACETPVIAFNQGAVPEVIHVMEKTEFTVENVEQAVHAVAHLDTIDRAVVRATFERRFSVDVNTRTPMPTSSRGMTRGGLRIAATKNRKPAPEGASPHAVPVLPLAGRA
jgi:glycosyltransferase involved in cell wall biosynthesis